MPPRKKASDPVGQTRNDPASQTYELVPPNALEAHPDNPRVHDLDAIRESIRVNGFAGALIAQKSTSRIIAGHGRWLAAQDLGLASVPVVFLDVDDDRALRILLADNEADLSSSEAGLEGTLFEVDLSEFAEPAPKVDDVALTTVSRGHFLVSFPLDLWDQVATIIDQLPPGADVRSTANG